MIVDHIKNLKLYQDFNENIKTVLKFIESQDLLKLPVGKTVIDGTNVYVIRESYIPRALDLCYFEGHLKYADIQLVLSGKEALGYRFKNNDRDILITDAYNDEKDVAKYQIKDFTKVVLDGGMFALVNPDDLHMPKLALEDSSYVEKIVFKIKVKGENLWQKL